MAKKGQKNRKYTREDKLIVVKRVLVNVGTQIDVERDILGVTNCTGTLNRWIKEYIRECDI